MMNNPRLRIIPVPVKVEGKELLLFQDQEGITTETVAMPMEAAAIIQFFDGNHSVRDIQQEILKQTGQLIDSEIIEGMAEELDKHFLLDSPRLHAHLRKLNEDWMNNKVRPSSHAGMTYPADPEELKKFMDGFYAHPEGPGPLPDKPERDDVKVIVAPHMDVRDSGQVTAHAFQELAKGTEADLFVIFGTGHMEPQRHFIMSDKDFETPLGVCETDRELVNQIQRNRSNRNPLNDYIHKDEHSIEFMVLFLMHALAGKRDFKILPVLAAGSAPSVLSKTAPEKDPDYRDFMEALKKALADRPGKTCFIAGADLAHLGPRYGDNETFGPVRMDEEKKNDMDMLDPLLSADRHGFFNRIAAIADKRRICGLPPIYAALHAAKPESGKMLKWHYWHDNATHSVVSYVSMSFY